MQRIKAVIAVIVDHSFLALLKEAAKKKSCFLSLLRPCEEWNAHDRPN